MTTAPTHKTPVFERAGSERILTVDVLRGFALFGILFCHMIFWYSGGPLPQDYYNPNGNIFSMITMGIFMIFFSAKFFSLFSFLFGLSFFIQMRALEKRGDNFVVRFAWRLAILGAIGMAHHILWRADILSIYVPLGFVLLAFRNLSNKTLLILGSLFLLNIPTLIAQLFSIGLNNQVELIATDFKSDGALQLTAFTQYGWHELFNYNFSMLKDKWIYQLNSGRGVITFGCFLLGMLAGRLQIFEKTSELADTIKRYKKRLWITLGIILAAIMILSGAVGALKIDVEKALLLRCSFSLLSDFFNAGITLMYILIISQLMINPKWQQRFQGFAAIGKMALTTYLMQTFIGVFLFFNVGLGLLGITNLGQNCLLSIAIFTSQMFFCKWWLTHFQYGPIEWLWRSATFLKLQPFRLQKSDRNSHELAVN